MKLKEKFTSGFQDFHYYFKEEALMYLRIIGVVALTMLISINVSTAEQTKKQVYLAVLSEDALLDGVPDDFDLKQFGSSLFQVGSLKSSLPAMR
jgi:hypothetical protein